MRPTMRSAAMGLAAAASLTLAACGSGSSSGPATASTSSAAGLSHTLNLALGFTDMTPDPAVWYGVNNEMETALYQGLLQYAPNTTKIEPFLATSWSISPDGKTYTFKLRTDVKFHDGTPFNCAAAKYSFARDIKINAGPSYMLATVASMACPSPSTFVVHLKTPTAAFLDYMCSPYGPKFVSPTTVNAHLGTNNGQTYLLAHDAGTGPYTLVKNNSSGLELTAYPGYWGPKPYYTTVNIAIIPDASTEVLELESGQLGFLADAVPIADLKSLAANPKLHVSYYPAVWKTMIFVNSHHGIFVNSALREVLKYAINPQVVTAVGRGPTGQTSTQFTPFGSLPAGAAPDTWTYDPSKVTKVLDTLPNKTVTIAYNSAVQPDGLAAEEVQVELQAAGFQATVSAINNAQFESLPAHPAQGPDIVLSTINPDTANPDSYFRIYMRSGGVLNLLGGSVPAADRLIDAASASPSAATREADWAKAAALYEASGDWIPVTDARAYVVSQVAIKDIVHSTLDPFGVLLGLTRP